MVHLLDLSAGVTTFRLFIWAFSVKLLIHRTLVLYLVVVKFEDGNNENSEVSRTTKSLEGESDGSYCSPEDLEEAIQVMESLEAKGSECSPFGDTCETYTYKILRPFSRIVMIEV